MGQEEVGETRALTAQVGERGASSLWAWCFAAGHPGAVCGSLPAGKGRSWGREQDRTSAGAGQGWGGGGEGQLEPQKQGDRSIRVMRQVEQGLQLSRAQEGSGAREGGGAGWAHPLLSPWTPVGGIQGSLEKVGNSVRKMGLLGEG